MQTIFSTADVLPAEAYDYWMDVTRRNISNNSLKTFDPSNFHGALKAGSLADLSFVQWRGSPGQTRTIDDGHLLLTMPPSGALVETADGREFETNRNSVYLMDFHRPVRVRSLEPVKRTAVRIPRQALTESMSFTHLVNRPITLTGDARLLVAFVRGLVRIGPSTLSPQAASLARGQLLDLLAVLLRSADRTAVLRRLHAEGLTDRQIGRRLDLEPVVVRAQRRRLGLAPNGSDPPFGSEEMDWLALQLGLGGKADRLLEQFRKVLLNVPRQPLRGQEDPDQ